MSATHKNTATAALHAGSDILATAYEARDLVHNHLMTSLTLCEDVLARCEQMKTATHEK